MSIESSLGDLAARTPETRERYIDFLRALSISVVIIGHWLMAAVTFRDGRFEGANALDLIPWAWVLTWVLQVMPLFFFVGGFANLAAWRSVRARGGGYADYLVARMQRLMKPTAVFVLIWLVISILLAGAGLSRESLIPMATMMSQPLWFIGVYVLIVALAPAMTRLHEVYRGGVILALASGVFAVDVVARGAGLAHLGYLNAAFVWLLVHQLGFFYADGTLPRWPRRRFLTVAAGALATMIALTASGLYPASMVGLAGGRTNMNPPTVALVAFTFWLVAIAMLLRERANEWLQRPEVWKPVIAVNGVIMTAFLWHLTALALGVGILLPAGFPQPEVGSFPWWGTRIGWVAALALILAPLLVLFSRFERPAGVRLVPRAQGRAAAAGAGLVALGLLGFAVTGFAPGGRGSLVAVPMTPLRCAIALGIGLLILRPERTRAA